MSLALKGIVGTEVILPWGTSGPVVWCGVAPVPYNATDRREDGLVVVVRARWNRKLHDNDFQTARVAELRVLNRAAWVKDELRIVNASPAPDDWAVAAVIRAERIDGRMAYLPGSFLFDLANVDGPTQSFDRQAIRNFLSALAESKGYLVTVESTERGAE